MRRGPSRAFRAVVALCCLFAGLVGGAPPAAAAPVRPAAVSGVGGVFVPLSQRVLDTRSGLGAPAGPLGPNGTVTVQIAGRGGVPASGVTSVRLNVTAVSPTATTYLTVYPSGSSRPVASSLNVDAGQVLSNLVTVPLGGDGRVVFYNHAGSGHVVADLVGFDSPDTSAGSGGHVLSSLDPTRVLDTRDGTGGHLGRVGPGGVVSVKVTGQDGVPVQSIGSVLLNVTAVNPSAAGYVTAYADGTSRPATSNLNFAAGQTVPILVIAPVGADGRVDLFNANGTVDLVADLAGYGTVTDSEASSSGVGTDGAVFDPLGPTRLLDTRSGAPVGPDGSVSVAVAGAHGVPAGATAVALNVTATGGTAATYVTAYPGGTSRPVASNLNVPAGATIANQVIVPVGADGTVTLYNHAGSVHLIADLAGYYTTGATSAWTVRAAPVPAGTEADSVSFEGGGVACAGTAGCVATGFQRGASPDVAALLLTTTGGGWTAVNPALPPDALSPPLAVLSAPVCPVTGTCLVFGVYETAGGGTGYLVLRGFGSSWTASELTLPAGADALTDGPLACGPTACVVPTASRDASGASHVVLITGDPATDPSQWAQVTPPAPDGTVTGVLSAGCGPTSCTVLGNRKDSGGVLHPYLITGSGGTWSVADAPLPPGEDGSGTYALSAVSCAAACAITGYHLRTTGVVWPVLLTGDGSTWTASIAQLPADVKPGAEPMYDSVVCPTTTLCAVTVRYWTALGHEVSALVSGWSTGWTSTPLPSPDSATVAVPSFGLACAGTSCVTVGGYHDLWGVDQFATGAGTLPTTSTPWPSVKVTPPRHAQSLYDIQTGGIPGAQAACASATFCVAVDTYLDNNGNTQGAILTGTT